MLSSRSLPAARPWVFMFFAVCLVAANMRMTIMGIGPLLETIAEDQGITPSALGFLASVPLLSWGLVSPFAHAISVRIGVSRTISWSLVALAVGTVVRSLPGSPIGLWLGTAFIGVALAISNVLMPAIIKREFPQRLAMVMGVYTALLSGMGSVAAGIVVPIAQWEVGGTELGWRVALLVTGTLIPIALIIWMIATSQRRMPRAPINELDRASSSAEAEPAETPPSNSGLGRRIWRDRLAWSVALYMAAQSAIFYMLSTWLAPFEVSQGYSAVAAGIDVMLLQLYGILGSLLTPLLFRGRLKNWTPIFVPAIIGTMAMGFLLVPSLMGLWLVICGLSCGASLSVALMLMAVRARTSEAATALSGMSQAVGYGIAALGPITFGLLHDISGGWGWPFALVFALAIGQSVIGATVRKEGFVFEGRGSQ